MSEMGDDEPLSTGLPVEPSLSVGTHQMVPPSR